MKTLKFVSGLLSAWFVYGSHGTWTLVWTSLAVGYATMLTGMGRVLTSGVVCAPLYIAYTILCGASIAGIVYLSLMSEAPSKEWRGDWQVLLHRPLICASGRVVEFDPNVWGNTHAVVGTGVAVLLFAVILPVDGSAAIAAMMEAWVMTQVLLVLYHIAYPSSLGEWVVV